MSQSPKAVSSATDAMGSSQVMGRALIYLYWYGKIVVP